MESQFLPRNKKLKPLASKLRSEMTKEESRLRYQFISKYPIRFNRQRIILSYIVDFYSYRAKLVIELDGSQHYESENMQEDRKRTENLEALGLQVIRFSI